MNANLGLFEIEQDGQTLILSPTNNLSELEFTSMESAVRDVIEQFESPELRNIVIDFAQTDYYGSSALGFFVKLWNHVQRIDGNLVFCNLSPREREVLELARLNTLWSVCSTRDEALRHIQAE